MIMIILRDKQYSSKLMKAVKTAKRVGNTVMTAIDNAGLKTSNAIKEAVTGKATPQHMKVGFKPKTNAQINRETIQRVRGAQRATKKAAQEIYYTPGAIADRGIKFAAENPIAAAGQAGSVVLPTVNPAFLGIPVGSPSVAVNAAAKKWRPYDRATKKIANAYERSQVSQGLRAMPSLPEIATQFGRALPL